MVIIGFCLINLMFGLLVYEAILVVSQEHQDLGMNIVSVVTWISLGSYTAAVLASGVCVALAGE
jgi:hypothetical protein